MGSSPSKVKPQNASYEDDNSLQHKLRKLWEATSVIEMIKGKEVYYLQSNATVLDASKMLEKRNVLSVPIYDEASKKVIGNFDFRDLVTLLIMACRRNFSELTQEEVIAALEEKYRQGEARLAEHRPGASAAGDMSKPRSPSSSGSGPHATKSSTSSPNQQPTNLNIKSNSGKQSPGPVSPKIVNLKNTKPTVVRARSKEREGKDGLSSTSERKEKELLINTEEKEHKSPASSISPASSGLTASSLQTPSVFISLQSSPQSPLVSTETNLWTLPIRDKARRLAEFLDFLDVKNAPVQLVMGLSGRNPLFVTHLATPLINAMTILAGHNKKSVHRVCVLDRKGQMAGILSQSRVLRYIASKMDEWENFSQSTLQELGLGYRAPPTVGWKQTVLQAFSQLEAQNQSSLAIVDENKRLVGTVSVTDVKYLFNSKELLLTLQRPISVFINAVRGSTTYWTVNIDSSSQTAQSHSVTLTLQNTLKDAVDCFLKNTIHRLWIVDAKLVPVSMVSLADILRLLLPPPIEKHTLNIEKQGNGAERGRNTSKSPRSPQINKTQSRVVDESCCGCC